MNTKHLSYTEQQWAMDEERRRRALRRAGVRPAVVAGAVAAVLLVGLAWQANLQATGPVRGGTGSSYPAWTNGGTPPVWWFKRTNRLFMPNPGGGVGIRV